MFIACVYSEVEAVFDSLVALALHPYEEAQLDCFGIGEQSRVVLLRLCCWRSG